MDRVQIGLIGFGEWARSAYVPTLAGLPDVAVATVAARSESSREAARAMLGGGIRTTPDYREVLADPEVDAVLVAVPNAMHREIALAAIESGKHLLMELPIALTPEDVAAVIQAAESAPQVVQFDFELRYLPVCRAAQDRVASGDMGRPLAAAVELSADWGRGGGVFNEPTARNGFYVWLGAWYLDVLDLLLGGPSLVRAKVSGLRAMNGPMLDHGDALLTYQGGMVGRLSHTLLSPDPEVRASARLLCERGLLELDLQAGALRQILVGGCAREMSFPPRRPVHGWPGMRESIEGFLAAIRTGAAVLGSPAAARRVHGVLFACHQADQGLLALG